VPLRPASGLPRVPQVPFRGRPSRAEHLASIIPISGAVAPSLRPLTAAALTPALAAAVAPCLTSCSPPVGDADWAEAAVGVTQEVVAYAWDAALRHELWLDFSLLPDDADSL